MIEIYAKGTTDFSRRGIRIHPQDSTVTFQDNGQFDFEMVVPAQEGYTEFDYGQIIRASVPEQDLDAITLGTVSYWQIKSGETAVNIYSQTPTWVNVGYNQWVYGQEYSIGSRVSYNRKNYQASTTIEGALTTGSPDVLPNNWSEISGGYQDSGKILATLTGGDTIIRTGDFNDTWMKAADQAGHEGFIEIAKCDDMSQTETRTLPARTITEQLFMVTEIRKEQNGSVIRVTAEHISYKLSRTMLGECSVTGVTPATALLFIAGAMKEEYGGGLYTNMQEPTLTADWSWKNAQSAVLDPKAGLLSIAGARLIRDNLDIIILAEEQEDPKYSVRYGANMKDVKWTGNVDNMVTRIYPTAQTEDGRTLLLPEEYIDSVRTVPFIRPEVLNTGLKVGQKETASDGTETVLTEEDVLDRMRTAARNRFQIDKCDMAEVSLELDWQHMPDTVEYAQYTELKNAAPGDMVLVVNGPLGISTSIRMTGYTWDPENETYKGATFGDIKTRPTVAGYNIKNGSITTSALGYNAVTGVNIQADSITAREIEAHSITADHIAARSIVTELLAAEAITANEIAANTITAEEIAAGSITTVTLAAQAITAEKIASNAITAGHIAADAVTAQAIQAGSVLAEKIAAGAVTTAKLDAYAVTAEKLAAGAVEADKIAADAITASKISANDLAAINAKLGTAAIASAQIAVADINYAQVKDLNAQSAYFGQAVIQEGLANKLYIPRLAANYAQIVNATISDLVIQAQDDNFYKLDVDLTGNVTATRITPSAQEISDGHTADGRTIYLGTDIIAQDLNTMNIYASHALMDQITANILDVDKLFAREATIAQLNVVDLSSNTYIRSTIGDWQSGSTITQSINGLNTKITELGYGTVYMQPDEPDHSHLTAGDIWVQTIADGSWQDVYDSYSSWQDIYENVAEWQALGGVPKMLVWDGSKFQLMYDAYLPDMLETEIEQLASEITLKATKTELDRVSGEVTEMRAQLTIQADEIEAAVSTVNAKAASFVMWEDPRTAYTVTLGDIWVKYDEEFCTDSTWSSVYDDFASWQALYNKHDAWSDMLGAKTFVWNGVEWVETSDRASEIHQRTLIDQTSREVLILAEASAQLGDELIQQRAFISVTASAIEQEVQRATTAEGGMIQKTNRLQTADAIVQEAVEQSVDYAEGQTGYIKKTSTYQDAESIKTEAVAAANAAASGTYIAKTSTIQTADALISEAVRQAGTAAEGEFIAKTTNLQTADQILMTAEGYADDHFYPVKSGIDIKAAGIEISGGTYVKIMTTGSFTVQGGNFSVDGNGFMTAKSGTIASWNIADSWLYTGSGSTCVTLVGASQGSTSTADWNKVKDYAMYAGANWPDSAPLRIKKDGTVYLTKLIAVAENGSETEVNLRTAGLWKLGYATVKSVTVEDNYCTSMTFSNSVGGFTSVNFKNAASVVATRVDEYGNPGGGMPQFTGDVMLDTGVTSRVTVYCGNYYNNVRTAVSPKTITISTRVGSTTNYSATIKRNNDTQITFASVDCSVPYADGRASVSASRADEYGNPGGGSAQFTADVTLNNNTTSRVTVYCSNYYNNVKAAGRAEGEATGYSTGWGKAAEKFTGPSGGTGTSFSVNGPSSTVDGTATKTFTIQKGATPGSTGYASVAYSGTVVGRIDIGDWYDAGWYDGYDEVTASVGEWDSGVATVTLSNENTVDVEMPAYASWSEAWAGSKVTVYCTAGGKTYSHTVDT